MGDDAISSSPSAVDAVESAGDLGGDGDRARESPMPSCANALGGGDFVFGGDVFTETYRGDDPCQHYVASGEVC